MRDETMREKEKMRTIVRHRSTVTLLLHTQATWKRVTLVQLGHHSYQSFLKDGWTVKVHVRHNGLFLL